MKNSAMNQMHQMHLFQGSRVHRKKFFSTAPEFTVFRCIHVHRGGFGGFYGLFLSIFSNKLVFRMHQMHMDAPLVNFKREFQTGVTYPAIRMHLCEGQKCTQVHLVH